MTEGETPKKARLNSRGTGLLEYEVSPRCELVTADRCDERSPFVRAYGCRREGGQQSSVRTDVATMRTSVGDRGL